MVDNSSPYMDKSRYVHDIRAAMDNFEEALKKVYEDEVRTMGTPWNLDREPPPITPERYGEESIPYWSSKIRRDLQGRITVVESQDLRELNFSVGKLLDLAALLGADGAPGPRSPIQELTSNITIKSGQWSGITGSQFCENFGGSTQATLDNHRDLAISLANLYTARIDSILATRLSLVSTVAKGIEKLGKSVDTSLVKDQWSIASLATIPVGFLPFAAAPPLGAALAVIATVGGYIDSRKPQEYDADIRSIYFGIKNEFETIKDDFERAQGEWEARIKDLQRGIHQANGSPFELYDVSLDNSDVGLPSTGFEVDTHETIESLSSLCFDASEQYEKAIHLAVDTDISDDDLLGANGEKSVGDQELIDTKDSFVSFLQTTCARYYETGERLTEAAQRYEGVETDNQEILKALSGTPDFNGAGQLEGGTVDEHIVQTDRSNIEDKIA